MRELRAFLDQWRREGLYTAARAYLVPAQRPLERHATDRCELVSARLVSWTPYAWVSADEFTLLVRLDLRLSGGTRSPFTSGRNDLHVRFTRGARDNYLMSVTSGP